MLIRFQLPENGNSGEYNKMPDFGMVAGVDQAALYGLQAHEKMRITQLHCQLFQIGSCLLLSSILNSQKYCKAHRQFRYQMKK
jgi:hypothetical protein